MSLKNDIQNFKNEHSDKLHKHRKKIKWLSVILIFILAVITVGDILNLLSNPSIGALFSVLYSVPLLLYFITRMFPHSHSLIESLDTNTNRKLLLIVALIGAIMSMRAFAVVIVIVFLILERHRSNNGSQKKTGSNYKYEPNNDSGGKFKFD